MKNFRKFSLLTLALAMVFTCITMTSCGSGSGNDGNVLLIGGIGPTSGDYANYGTSVKQGAILAVEEINKNGGVNGFTLKLDFQDSAADPDSAVAAFGKQMDKGMKLSLGATFSGETMSVVAAAKEDGILILTPSASADKVIEGNDAAFRVCFSDSSQGIASAKYISDNNLAKKVAVFYQSDIDYSKGLYDKFVEESANKGITITTTQSFTIDTNTDFTTQINAIKTTDSELIFMPIYAADAAKFLTQAKGAFSKEMIYFGCDGLDGILSKISNPADAENVMMLTPFAADAENDHVKAFVAAYGEAYKGEVPDQFAADGYDAVYVLKAVIEKAGFTPDNLDNLNSRAVAAMLEIEVAGVTGTMTWDASGETSKSAMAMIIHDGVAKAYTK